MEVYSLRCLKKKKKKKKKMVDRITGKYITIIYIRIDTELIESVGYMISRVHVDIFY